MLGQKFLIRIKDIDIIVYDFDGVMTDNHVFIFQDGSEAVIVNRADGFGVRYLRELGVPQLMISSEVNSIVRARAEKLQLEVIDSCKDKKNALKNYCAQKDFDLKRVIYVGNDLNDLEVMKIVGFPVAPADAHPRIKRIAKLITKVKGGQGVINELLSYIDGGIR